MEHAGNTAAGLDPETCARCAGTPGIGQLTVNVQLAMKDIHSMRRVCASCLRAVPRENLAAKLVDLVMNARSVVPGIS